MTAERHWRYTAEDDQGAVVKGAMTAADPGGVIAQLKEQGLAPLDVEEDRRASGFLPILQQQRSGALSQRDATQFCTRMADLLNAGVPASKALALIARQSGGAKMKAFARRLESRLRSGETLSAALTSDPAAPPRIMTALIASGEALGNLGGQFTRLAAAFEARAALRKEIVSQLIYPTALFVLIILTMVFLSFFVLPQFEGVFSTSAAAPPAETQIVLAAGAFIRAHWLTAALALVVFILSAQWFAQRNRARAEALALASPIFGPALRKMETGRYCRTLGELLCGGMPLARAMPIARAAVSFAPMRESVNAIEIDVRNGAALSKAARDAAQLDPEALSFFELGEETGALGVMIEKAADYLEEQIATRLKRFAALSGPIMTAIMGLLTAGVIAAVMAGVLSLNDAVY